MRRETIRNIAIAGGVAVALWIIIITGVMETVFWAAAVAGGAVLIYLATHQWREHNNRILGGLIALTVISVIVASFFGGGEPLLGKAMKGLAARDGIANMYLPSPAFTGGVAEAEYGSWFWWKLALFLTLYTILFLPAAFVDELAAGWNRFMEWWEQRTEVIELREPQAAPAGPPPAAPEGGAPPAPPQRRGFWQKVTDNIPEAIIADVAIDTAVRVGRRIFR